MGSKPGEPDRQRLGKGGEESEVGAGGLFVQACEAREVRSTDFKRLSTLRHDLMPTVKERAAALNHLSLVVFLK